MKADWATEAPLKRGSPVLVTGCADLPDLRGKIGGSR
jgi:hypothetical protein